MKILFTALFALLGGLIALTIGALIRGVIVYFLWNALMPELFGLTLLSIWQAIGLTWLSAFFFSHSSSSSK